MVVSYCLVLVLCIGLALCNTGLDVPKSKVDTELRLLKDEMSTLRQELNYERTARIDLDKELSALTKRYRQLSLENDDIKAAKKDYITWVSAAREDYITWISDAKSEIPKFTNRSAPGLLYTCFIISSNNCRPINKKFP